MIPTELRGHITEPSLSFPQHNLKGTPTFLISCCLQENYLLITLFACVVWFWRKTLQMWRPKHRKQRVGLAKGDPSFFFNLCAQSDLADVTTPRFHFVSPMWKLLVLSWLSLYNHSSPSWRVSLCSLYPSERLPGAWLGNPELVHRTVTWMVAQLGALSINININIRY